MSLHAQSESADTRSAFLAVLAFLEGRLCPSCTAPYGAWQTSWARVQVQNIVQNTAGVGHASPCSLPESHARTRSCPCHTHSQSASVSDWRASCRITDAASQKREASNLLAMSSTDEATTTWALRLQLRLRRQRQRLKAVLKAHSSTLLLPLLVFCCAVAGGVAGVVKVCSLGLIAAGSRAGQMQPPQLQTTGFTWAATGQPQPPPCTPARDVQLQGPDRVRLSSRSGETNQVHLSRTSWLLQ